MRLSLICPVMQFVRSHLISKRRRRRRRPPPTLACIYKLLKNLNVVLIALIASNGLFVGNIEIFRLNEDDSNINVFNEKSMHSGFT